MALLARLAELDRRATTPEKFWTRVLKSNGCWLWTGRCDEKGYGRVGFGGRANIGAHRVAWELTQGPVPLGLCVLHRCDTPSCCNPDHLFLGTNRDNVIDRHLKGRSKNLDAGHLHPKAKLTQSAVAQMRALRLCGLTQIQLAERFGISRGNVSKILAGKSYQ